jgi:hypothetical protein
MSGPVQVLVVGFGEPSFSGGVMAELERLRAAGVVRLVDVLLVRREADGRFETLPAPYDALPEAGRVVAEVLGGGDGAPPEGPTWSLEEAVEPGTTAAVALLEHLWAAPLVEAIAASGGRPLAEMWLSPEDRARVPDLSAGASGL